MRKLERHARKELAKSVKRRERRARHWMVSVGDLPMLLEIGWALLVTLPYSLHLFLKDKAEAVAERQLPSEVSPLSAQEETQYRVEYLARLIPREYREAILGDILEDCFEHRDAGEDEARVRRYAIRQLLQTVFLSWPAILLEAVKRVFTTK